MSFGQKKTAFLDNVDIWLLLCVDGMVTCVCRSQFLLVFLSSCSELRDRIMSVFKAVPLERLKIIQYRYYLAIHFIFGLTPCTDFSWAAKQLFLFSTTFFLVVIVPLEPSVLPFTVFLVWCVAAMKLKKSTNIFHEMLKCLTFVLLWLKNEFMKFGNWWILFLFTFTHHGKFGGNCHLKHSIII